MVRISHRSRRGTIVPLMALSLVALCSFIALAVDVGMILGRAHPAQNAADVAAMTGSRTLDEQRQRKCHCCHDQCHQCRHVELHSWRIRCSHRN